MAKYHTLLERHENGRWGVAFGDYDRETVEDERQEYLDQGVPARRLAIVTSDDSQDAIDALVGSFRVSAS